MGEYRQKIIEYLGTVIKEAEANYTKKFIYRIEQCMEMKDQNFKQLRNCIKVIKNKSMVHEFYR